MAELKYAKNLIINEKIPIGGIAVTLKNNKTRIRRFFCDCGFVSSKWHDYCPNCNREIIYLGEKKHFSFFFPEKDFANNLHIKEFRGTIDYENNSEDVIVNFTYSTFFIVSKTGEITLVDATCLKEDYRKIAAFGEDYNDEVRIALDSYIDGFSKFMKNVYYFEGAYLYYYIALMLKYNKDIYLLSDYRSKASSGEKYGVIFSSMLDDMFWDRSTDWPELLKEKGQKQIRDKFDF